MATTSSIRIMSQQLKNDLSFIIHTKNEAKNIADCIDSVKSIADEIIVIDMSSTDQTVSIARKKGAQVFAVEDMGSADPARNFGLSQARYKWILYLDADERLPRPLIKTIPEIIKQDKFDLVKFPEKNIILNKWLNHGMWWPDYHIRLFKKGHLDYPKTVHTQPQTSGKILTLPAKEENAIIHLHRQTIKQFLEMIDHYSSLDQNFVQTEVNGKTLTPSAVYHYINKEFNWRFMEHQGYLDGTHGFMVSQFMNFYRFLEVAKYWEASGFSELFTNLELKNSASEINPPTSQHSSELETFKASKVFKAWRFYHRLKQQVFKKWFR